jgi:hypothetical protein
MTHKIRFAFAAAVGLLYLADGAVAAPVADSDHAVEKAPAKGGNGGKGAQAGAKGGKKGKNKEDYVGPIKKEKYPIQERLRPLTLSKGMVEGTLDIGVGPIVKGQTETPVGLGSQGVAVGSQYLPGIGLSYGLAPVVDVHIGTGFAFSPKADWSHVLNIGANYLAYDSHDFDLALGLALDTLVQDNGSTSLSLNVPMRYLAGDYFDIHGAVGVPLVLSPDVYLAISANPGIGLQASKDVYLSLDTTIFTLALADKATAQSTWLGDIWPLALTAQYSVNRDFDLGIRLSDVYAPLPDPVPDAFSFGLDLYVTGRF